MIIPKKGDVIKLSTGTGVILDIYKNETGDAILKILYGKNVVKLQDPELLPLQLAEDLGSTITDAVNLFADLESNRQWYQRQYDRRLGELEAALKPG